MKHPISGSALLIYVLFWAVMVAGHTAVLVQVNDFPVDAALLDNLLFYPVLAGFGISYFYVVRYVSPEAKPSPRDLLIHAAGLIFIVGMITIGHDQIVIKLIDAEGYSDYLRYSFGWRFATGVLILSVVVLIHYLAIRNRMIEQQGDKEDALKQMLKQTEMEMLKFQINPHFIFNSLNSISALTMTAPDKAQEMIIKLSDFFRKALGTEKDDMHTVEEELNQIELYLDIERIRFGDRLNVTSNVESPCSTNTLPALILQPLFENAIKHGVYENLEEVEINTSITCKEGRLHVTIANTYDPMQSGLPGAGIGLKNVRARLELMYGIPDLVTIERTNKYYKVHLLIPQL